VLPTHARHTRRGHEEKVEREVLTGLQQQVDAGHALHVADFVRIENQGAGPVRDNQAGKLGWHQERALQVHVGVEQAGDDGLPPHVNGFSRRPLVRSHPRDETVRDNDVGGIRFFGKDVDDLPADERQVPRLLAERDADAALQLR
jgi:hypothetical protein